MHIDISGHKQFSDTDAGAAPHPLLLIKDGRLMRKNLEKELITEDELMSQLRQQGHETIKEIKKCYLESNGHFSVMTGKPEKAKQKGTLHGAPVTCAPSFVSR